MTEMHFANAVCAAYNNNRATPHRGPENPARDIADAVYADVTGTRHRTPTHYGTPREEEQA